jgi:hypothetical protein
MRPPHGLYAKEGIFHAYGSSEYEYLLGKRSTKKLTSLLMIPVRSGDREGLIIQQRIDTV